MGRVTGGWPGRFPPLGGGGGRLGARASGILGFDGGAIGDRLKSQVFLL